MVQRDRVVDTTAVVEEAHVVLRYGLAAPFDKTPCEA